MEQLEAEERLHTRLQFKKGHTQAISGQSQPYGPTTLLYLQEATFYAYRLFQSNRSHVLRMKTLNGVMSAGAGKKDVLFLCLLWFALFCKWHI